MAKKETKDIVPAFKPWKYEDSVAVAKPLVATYKKISLDLVRELYAAREALANSGYRTDLTNGKAYHPTETTSSQMLRGDSDKEKQFHTFQSYLDDIGLNKMTANRWLVLYSPREDKLYTPEEYQDMLIALFQRVQANRVTKYGWEPEGWTSSLERKYQRWLAAERIATDLAEKDRQRGELFSREYLLQLKTELQDDPTPDEILRFNELCTRYEPVVGKEVKIEKPMTIVQMVEKAVEALPETERPKVMETVVVVLNDLLQKKEV